MALSGCDNGEEVKAKVCPAGYAHGYADIGTYEPIPFVGEFIGGEFVPLSPRMIYYQTSVEQPQKASDRAKRLRRRKAEGLS